jgi:uncharacterized Zn finger protein
MLLPPSPEPRSMARSLLRRQRYCPSCGSDQAEPLTRLQGRWHLRCLDCGVGFDVPESAFPERRQGSVVDASVLPLRRGTDVRVSQPCVHCGHGSMLAWVRTQEVVWLRCSWCSRVARLAN